jgi:hypothetical protein
MRDTLGYVGFMSNDTMKQISLRLPQRLLDAAEVYAAESTQPGQRVQRSDGIRMLMERGLDAVGRCAATHGNHVCTLHQGHKRSHYDSHTDKSWSAK